MKTKYGITLKPRTGKHPPVRMDLGSDEGKRRFRDAVNKVMATHAEVINALAKR